MSNNKDLWEPVEIADLLGMAEEQKEPTYVESSGAEVPEVIDFRELDYSKVTTVEDIVCILKGLDLAVDFKMASDELKKYLK